MARETLGRRYYLEDKSLDRINLGLLWPDVCVDEKFFGELYDYEGEAACNEGAQCETSDIVCLFHQFSVVLDGSQNEEREKECDETGVSYDPISWFIHLLSPLFGGDFVRSLLGVIHRYLQVV